MDLPHNLEINTSLYYVDSLSGLAIDSRISLDLNVAWHPTDNATITVGGRNLFQGGQREFNDTMDGIVASEIEQTLYAKLTMIY